jgi:hypothetical protein
MLLSLLESSLVTDPSQHTAYAGSMLGLLDIQLLIDGKLAFSAGLTEVVRPTQFHLAQNAEQTLGT